VNDDLPSRFLSWLYRLTAPHLLTWLPLAGITGVISQSLQAANWVPDSSPLIKAAWFGLVLGGLLAASRFRGWAAATYHLWMAIVLLGSWVGKVLPPLSQILQQPFLSTLGLVNIRLLSTLDRLVNWVTILKAGNNVQDNGLFLLSIGLLTWAASAWLTWAVIRRQRALDGLLPTGLLLGVNAYLSGQTVDGLWFFLGCAILLAARTAIIEMYRSWERRQVDYPDDLSLNWAGATLGFGLVIVFAARLSPIFGTPEGWKTLGDYFREAQKQLEDTTTHLFGNVAPPAPHYEGFQFTPVSPAPAAETPEMGLIGAAPSQSREVVMWVKTNDPPPPVPEPGFPIENIGPGPIHYWRSAVFGNYTGTGWENLDMHNAPGTPGATSDAQPPPPTGIEGKGEGIVPGRYLLAQEVQIVGRHGATLFAASIPVETSAGTALQYAGPDGTPLVYGSVSSYRVQSWVTETTDVMLRAASSVYPPEIAGTYLQLPASLPQRVRDLARRIVADAATPYDKAVRIQDYLRLSYKYDLKVPLPPSGQDVVDYFLFDSSGGFCTYYASAMAVMLRSQGVAARVASGFATGSFDFTRSAYQVTPADAHAWVEVYFPGYGWVEFEPTAGLARIPYETPAGSAGRINAPLPPRPIPPMPVWQRVALAAAAVAGPLLLFGLVFWLWLRRRRLIATSTPARLAELHYLQLRRLLGWAGLDAPPSATPAEYLREYIPILEGRGTLPALLTQATWLYQQAVYSPRPPGYEEVNLAQRQAGRVWGDFGRLFVRRIWQHLRGER
jgi:transglutaminase-like putative cysteine protease